MRLSAHNRCFYMQGTQIFINSYNELRAYFLDARFILQHLYFAHNHDEGQCAIRYIGQECFQ